MDIFPREIFQLILQYLPLNDLGRVSKAISNHSIQVRYLSSLNKMVYFGILSIRDSNTRMLQWILHRNIFLSHVIVCDSQSLYLQKFLKSPCRLTIQTLKFTNSIEISPFLIDVFPSLTSISITCDWMRHIETFDQFLTLNPQVTKLKLCVENVSLSPRSVLETIVKCENLRELDISENDWLTDRDLSPLMTDCRCQNLKVLNLNRTGIESDQTIHMILEAFPNLTSISFADCCLSERISFSCFQSVLLPSLLSPDPERLFHGMHSLCDYIDDRGQALFQETLISHDFIHLFFELLKDERDFLRNEASRVLCFLPSLIKFDKKLPLLLNNVRDQGNRQLQLLCLPILLYLLDRDPAAIPYDSPFVYEFSSIVRSLSQDSNPHLTHVYSRYVAYVNQHSILQRLSDPSLPREKMTNSWRLFLTASFIFLIAIFALRFYPTARK